MRIRQSIEFADDCPNAVETWPDSSGLRMAIRWGRAMCTLNPGACDLIEMECDEHGWEELRSCEDCGEPVCELEGWDGDDRLCEDCADTREAETCDGCRGYAVAGCEQCVGVSRYGSI